MVATTTQPVPSATIACTHPTNEEVHMDQDLDYALLQSGSQQLTEHSNQYTGTSTNNLATTTTTQATSTLTTTTTTSSTTATVSVSPLTHATALPRTSTMSSVPVVSTYNTEPHSTSVPTSSVLRNSAIRPTPAPTRSVTMRYTFDHPSIQNLAHRLTSLMHSKLYHQQCAHFFRSAIEYDRPPFFTAPILDINEQSRLSTTNQERWAAATKE